MRRRSRACGARLAGSIDGRRPRCLMGTQMNDTIKHDPDAGFAPAFAAPPRACDAHFHVFGPAGRYPYGTDIRYKPPYQPLEAYLKLARRIGFQRYVFVQPSVYGFDNSCMLDCHGRTRPGDPAGDCRSRREQDRRQATGGVEHAWRPRHPGEYFTGAQAGGRARGIHEAAHCAAGQAQQGNRAGISISSRRAGWSAS